MVLNALREKGWSAKLHIEATIKSCPHMVDILVRASTNHKVVSFCDLSDLYPRRTFSDIVSANLRSR
jgi:hypothetical protein